MRWPRILWRTNVAIIMTANIIYLHYGRQSVGDCRFCMLEIKINGTISTVEFVPFHIVNEQQSSWVDFMNTMNWIFAITSHSLTLTSIYTVRILQSKTIDFDSNKSRRDFCKRKETINEWDWVKWRSSTRECRSCTTIDWMEIMKKEKTEIYIIF